ncbi:BnaCnng22270D [Brassica napus]|uniref:(rape) hypothetical protein n=1 Tax=Brassica napus TaxID=3708 RepID=A0A078ISG3_BRANA|nr:unnamed protein product [Brassica napus]CDY52389.1 BnaCnng22270D [Brassica napus]
MNEWESAQPNRPTAALKPQPLSLLPRSTTISTTSTVCNTDASWKSGSAGLAWIFSDHTGTELSRKSISLEHVSSPIMAEALAIRGALLHATSTNITYICLRSDSQVLVQAICQRKWTMELYGVLSDIDSLSLSVVSPFASCCFIFIPRTENGPADQLTKGQLSSSFVIPFNGSLISINEFYVAQKKERESSKEEECYNVLYYILNRIVYYISYNILEMIILVVGKKMQ